MALVEQCRKALKEGIPHATIHYSHKVGSNIDTIKSVFKVKSNKDEDIKIES